MNETKYSMKMFFFENQSEYEIKRLVPGLTFFKRRFI